GSSTAWWSTTTTSTSTITRRAAPTITGSSAPRSNTGRRSATRSPEGRARPGAVPLHPGLTGAVPAGGYSWRGTGWHDRHAGRRRAARALETRGLYGPGHADAGPGPDRRGAAHHAQHHL